MTKKRRAKLLFFFFSLIIVLFLAVFVISFVKNWEREVTVETETFTESARAVQNPNRGFYNLYSFLITDKKQDYSRMISRLYRDDTDTRLTLIQVCLKSYSQSVITDKGIANIEALFDALGTLDKQLIVRFTYDGEGQNEQYEPENMDIILTHMEQLSYIFHKYSEKIFIMQGLFIGNWGEMNGTQYSSGEDLRRLAEKLARMTEQSIYLAVRVPAQWRSIMQSQSSDILSGRLGLFNDGMLGNESDYGTYRIGDEADTELFPRLEREKELEFQDKLCREVPNGGEVIHDNIYNDLDNAIKDLGIMHVTYLNEKYDQAVLDKWAETTVTEAGCFQGMDGLTYIERHLGYRLVLTDADLRYQDKEDEMFVEAVLKNVGFAPLYKEAKARIVFYNEKNDETLVYPVSQNLRVLAGGSEKEDTLTLSVKVPFRELTEKEYTVYLSIVDSDTGERILLGNEEDEEAYGYRIGKFGQ